MSTPGTTLSQVLPSPAEKEIPKAQQVEQMFDRIAARYDLLNDVISFGMHRYWKPVACQKLNLQAGASVLDVCTGTGDLLALLAQQVGPHGQVTGLDFSADMLQVARQRHAEMPNLALSQGDALALPFENNQFDGAIVSFGLRNVVDVPMALQEMTRVVKPGGWVVNLDTHPKPNLPGFWLYFKLIMPMLSGLLGTDPKAYSYLSHSTANFYTPEQLVVLFKQVGLDPVKVTNLSFGAVSIQAGQKPGLKLD